MAEDDCPKRLDELARRAVPAIAEELRKVRRFMMGIKSGVNECYRSTDEGILRQVFFACSVK
tara:strand:+ start:13577 stop:13762 length:186 start_codon:yes stop_codon:yes gene_type:complete